MNIPAPASPAAAIELADTLLHTAIRILYESHGELDFPEYYVRCIACRERFCLAMLETTASRGCAPTFHLSHRGPRFA
jgi:hypothetical protein